MEWETKWIRNNLHRYDSPLHAESVIENIRKRKLLVNLEKKIKNLEEQIDGYKETDS